MKFKMGLAVWMCGLGAFGAALDLSGTWAFQLDAADEGVSNAWYKTELSESLQLPGSLQAQGFGFDVNEQTAWIGKLKDTRWVHGVGKQKDGSYRVVGWLQPDKHYVGAAWYQREITVPESWAGKELLVSFERVHISSTLWLDGERVGEEQSLFTPHRYRLGSLTPGTHRLTLRVDNRLPVDVGENAHAVSDHTQTAWNGVVGEIKLEALPSRWVDFVSVFPDVANHQIKVKIGFGGTKTPKNSEQLRFKISVPAGADQPKVWVVDAPSGAQVETVIPMGDSIALWDEFTPNLYGLKVSLLAGDTVEQTVETTFGMVEYRVENQQFMVNGRPTFFRGTLDCATFPLTGYPSMDPAYWKRVFEVCKAHGLNHVRYHSWFPPEVALIEADKAGVYLQCEYAWARFRDPRLLPYLEREAERALRRYGNHPSFALHAYGNEPAKKGPGEKLLFQWVEKTKALDEGRRFYVSAAGWSNTANSDFYELMRGLRVYPWGAGLRSSINKEEPSFLADFSKKTAEDPTKPYVAHETGQWCVYPDFDEIKKYTGFLKPRNFEIFQENLEANHMGDLAKDFMMASGKLQTLCYKYEIEKLLRTPGCGGYQLLGLNDFPGQGTALVGAVDVFWDTKPYTTPEEYRSFNGSSVPLARFPKFIFTEGETATLQIDMSHFGAAPLTDAKVRWIISSSDGTVLKSGKLDVQEIPVGLSTLATKHSLALEGLPAPAQYSFSVAVAGTQIKNAWNFWVYPSTIPQKEGTVKITRDLSEALTLLNAGGSRKGCTQDYG